MDRPSLIDLQKINAYRLSVTFLGKEYQTLIQSLGTPIPNKTTNDNTSWLFKSRVLVQAKKYK